MKSFKNAILALKISVKGLRDKARDIVDCDVIISDAIRDSLTCCGKKIPRMYSKILSLWSFLLKETRSMIEDTICDIFVVSMEPLLSFSSYSKSIG
jgi:hypothetical protein